MERVHALFLDVASHCGLIAAVSADAIVASRSIDHRINDSALLPAIEGVVKKAGLKWEDLTRIVCVCGPGGFTSLRVGVSAANALAWGLKIPSCAVHLSDLYVARSRLPDCVWLHSTKKTALFLRGFGEYRNLAPEAELMPLEHVIRIIPDDAELIGEIIPEHEEALSKHGLSLVKVRPIEEILPQFLSTQNYSEQTIQPWYGRGI